MPRTCTACTHPKHVEIDKALVAETSLRNIAERFSLSVAAINRHKKSHLPDALVQARVVQEEADAIDVMAELRRCFERVNLLFDACDRWLRDADDPTRYDIGPRAEEVDVTYDERIEDRNGQPRTVRRKKSLAELLDMIAGERRTVTMVETKHADPRELVLKTANRLQGQTELFAKLIGELSDGNTINITVSPEWAELRSIITGVLQAHPEALQDFNEAVIAMEGGDGHVRVA